MKIALKDFQETAVTDLVKMLQLAKYGVRNGILQAVILSAPTGSGKTVITAALIEEILQGSDRFQAEPDAVFLWLSDQPELNAQSRQRIAAVIETIPKANLVIVGSDFNQKVFAGGKLYFLNTGKLGKDKLLTSGKGDHHQYTIWETITHTADTLKDRFYLIIDEAHRGMKIKRGEEATRQTIVQKFVLGSLGEIPPIDLILGMSATPKRFDVLLKTTQRTRSPVDVPPEDVRASGLLKDTIIVYHPHEDFSTDSTLLAEAARKWKEMRDAWRDYTQAQNLPAVTPAMVIQVEDGGEHGISRTDLDKIVHTLEQEIDGLQHGDIAHCFEHDAPFSAGGWIIPKVDASLIQEMTVVKIVLFKMALTTGWDCPRAEVMMSFRSAQDDTLIAQLIGRMVRTPLARRIEGRELLNTVALYLPKYHRENVKSVIDRLRNDPDALPPTDVEDGAKLLTFKRDPTQAAAFEALTGLPTYRVERVRKASNTRRLMRLARLLTMLHEIDLNAWNDAKKIVIETLDAAKNRLQTEDPDFEAKLSSHGEITIQAVAVEQGTWKESEGQPVNVHLDQKNIDELFERAGHRLGEGLHLDYWQSHYNEDDPSQPKLALFLILQNEKAWNALEKATGERIQTLFKQHNHAINQLTTAEREEYNKVREIAKDPEALEFLPPTEIMVGVDADPQSGFRHYPYHLFVDEKGMFPAKFNQWEQSVIEQEMQREDFVGWLRNVERKPWALLIPYKYRGEEKPMFPDFLVVRKEGGHLVVDILEPHGDQLADNFAKAVGLADFAAKHAAHFGRVDLIRMKNGEIMRLDFTDQKIRAKVQHVDSNQALDLIFGG